LIVAIALTGMTFTACKNGNADKKLEKVVADTANYTTIQWLDSIKNFGTINQGDKIQILFRCKNTGTKPLIIANARPGCGCTIADYTHEPIAPGAEGLVTASFDSNHGHASGEVRKTVMVTTNTKGNTEHYLIFTGEVKGGTSTDSVMQPHPGSVKVRTTN